MQFYKHGRLSTYGIEIVSISVNWVSGNDIRIILEEKATETRKYRQNESRHGYISRACKTSHTCSSIKKQVSSHLVTLADPRIVPLEHHLHGLKPLILDRHPNVGRPSDQSEPDPVETLHQLEEDGLGGPLGEGDLLGDGEVLGVVDEEVELHADLVDAVEGARLDPVADGLDLAALDVDLDSGNGMVSS